MSNAYFATHYIAHYVFFCIRGEFNHFYFAVACVRAIQSNYVCIFVFVFCAFLFILLVNIKQFISLHFSLKNLKYEKYSLNRISITFFLIVVYIFAEIMACANLDDTFGNYIERQPCM